MTHVRRLLTIALAGAALPAFAQPDAGDAARGARLFLQCRACHAVAPGTPHGVGPNLVGVVGAKAAAKPGYAYSPALAKSGIVWTPAALDGFLTRPNTSVPGTKMAFGGMPDAKARADVIAYLATLKAGK